MITVAALTKHYRSIIASPRIEIFYRGAHDNERLAEKKRASAPPGPAQVELFSIDVFSAL